MEVHSFYLVARVRRFLRGESLDGALREFQPESLAPAARSPFPSLDFFVRNGLKKLRWTIAMRLESSPKSLCLSIWWESLGKGVTGYQDLQASTALFAAEDANASAGFDMLLTGTDGRDLASHLRVSFPSCVIVGSAAGLTAAEIAIEIKGHAMTAGSCIISSNELINVLQERGPGYVVLIVDLLSKQMTHAWFNPKEALAQKKLVCMPRTLFLTLP